MFKNEITKILNLSLSKDPKFNSFNESRKRQVLEQCAQNFRQKLLLEPKFAIPEYLSEEDIDSWLEEEVLELSDQDQEVLLTKILGLVINEALNNTHQNN